MLPAIDGGEDAEEKIKARKRQIIGENQHLLTHSLTRHYEEASTDTDSPKGESAALSKSMFLEMYLSDFS